MRLLSPCQIPHRCVVCSVFRVRDASPKWINTTMSLNVNTSHCLIYIHNLIINYSDFCKVKTLPLTYDIQQIS